MKNNRLKLSLAAFGLVVGLLGSTVVVSAQTTLCGWDDELEWCTAIGRDGLCAYGGPDCTTTIPTVE
jgi:hypothetical protein